MHCEQAVRCRQSRCAARRETNPDGRLYVFLVREEAGLSEVDALDSSRRLRLIHSQLISGTLLDFETLPLRWCPQPVSFGAQMRHTPRVVQPVRTCLRNDWHMGKKSRRASRRKRNETVVGGDGLRITVGVVPRTRPNGQPSLEDELRLLRSSLLYADHVDLVAPSAAWMNDFRPLRDIDADDPWRTVSSLPSETLRRIGIEDVTPREFRRAMKKLEARPFNDPDRLESERQWREAIPQMKKQADEVFDSYESIEIDMALESDSVSMVSDGTRFQDSADQQIAWFRDRLVEALADPASHVLLDETTTGFLSNSEDHPNGIPSVAAARSRRVAVGTGLVEKLPTFPDAPMAHVLEARSELAEGRARYRASAKSLADKLQSSALDATLSSEIDDLWHDEVRPSLEDLRKTASMTRIAFETSKRLVTEGYGVPTVAVAIANIPDLVSMLPSAAAAAGAAGRVVAAGAAEAFRARSTVRQHDLVYLLDVDKKLGRS